jgi:hypothetical protein
MCRVVLHKYGAGYKEVTEFQITAKVLVFLWRKIEFDY